MLKVIKIMQKNPKRCPCKFLHFLMSKYNLFKILIATTNQSILFLKYRSHAD